MIVQTSKQKIGRRGYKMEEKIIGVEKAIKERRRWLAVCEANRLARNDRLKNSEWCVSCFARPKSNNTFRCEKCNAQMKRRKKRCT